MTKVEKTGELPLGLLRALVERLPHGVTVWRADTDDPADLRLVYANPRSSEESGVDNDAIMGTTVGETYAPALEAPPELNIPAAWMRVATGGEPEVMERVPYGDVRHPQGWFDIHMVPIGDRCVANVYENVTKRLRAEQAVRKHTEELERSNRELEQFAYAISHDLKAPLRTVRGFTEILMTELGDALREDQIRQMRMVAGGVARMQTLIDGLLSFCRVGVRPDEVEPVDTADLLEEVLRMLDADLEEAGATVEAAGLPTLPGALPQLHRLFQNLVENAVRYRRPGAPLTVRVSCERSGEEWIFSFADNGPGIAPEMAESAFELLRRLPGAEDFGHGCGMGLAVCRKVVELHGGRIWVESDGRSGSTFRFTLPAGAGGRGAA